MQREAAQEEHERILAQQREQLDNDRKAAESARRSAQTAEREAMLERERVRQPTPTSSVLNSFGDTIALARR